MLQNMSRNEKVFELDSDESLLVQVYLSRDTFLKGKSIFERHIYVDAVESFDFVHCIGVLRSLFGKKSVVCFRIVQL